MYKMEDAKKLVCAMWYDPESWEPLETYLGRRAWDVWEVYKGWGNYMYLKYRPYRPYLTTANISMTLVTIIALVVGFVVFFRKRREKEEKLIAEREAMFEQDRINRRQRMAEREKLRDAERLKKLQLEKENRDKVREPPNCPFKHLFGGLLESPHGPGQEEGEEGNDETMATLRDQIHKNIKQSNDAADMNEKNKSDLKKHNNESGDNLADYAEDLSPEDEDSDDSVNLDDLPPLTKDGRDPLELAMHIPAELKKIKNKITTREMEKRLTADQKQEEALARRQQLEQIFKLMQDQKDKFGEQDNDDIEEQMRMYSL